MSVADPDRDIDLQGTYAGIVTRLSGWVIDAVVVLGAFTIAGKGFDYLMSAVFGADIQLRQRPWLSGLLLAGWAFFYCAYSLAAGGRTLGMAIVGLRAVGRDGDNLTGKQAVIRVLVTPLSFVLFFAGIWLILIRRDRRALHDLIAGTAVVYGWDARAARLRFLAKQPSPTSS
ncbi:MAG TPA: RDD family protein [Acidimicrobiales bacterium]|nr:RDD family protein [Acidimicrobiales bacterium]